MMANFYVVQNYKIKGREIAIQADTLEQAKRDLSRLLPSLDISSVVWFNKTMEVTQNNSV